MTVNFFPKEPGMMGPVIPALGRLRQNFKFKVSFDSIMGPFLKKKKKKKENKVPDQWIQFPSLQEYIKFKVYLMFLAILQAP
jgi:hypothetical protein